MHFKIKESKIHDLKNWHNFVWKSSPNKALVKWTVHNLIQCTCKT